MARLYAVEEYAAFQTWWTLFMLVVPIAEGGFTASLYHRLPNLATAERNGLLWRTFKALCVLGLAAAGVIWVASPLLAGLFKLPAAAAQVASVAFFIGGALPAFALQAHLLVDGKSAAVALLDIAGAVATGLALFVPAAFDLPITWGLWGLSAYAVLRTVLIAAWFSRTLLPRLPAGGVRDQLQYAGQVSSARAMGVATKQLDRFFVGAMGDVKGFSVYATGALEIPFISVLTGSAATVLAPEISKRFHDGDKAGALRLWHESIRKVALFLFPIGAVMVALAHPMFTVLYGAELAEASFIFQVFSLALPLRAAQYGSVLLAVGDSTRVLWGSLLGLGCNVALCLWWVPLWGGMGAALATVVSVYVVVAAYLKPLRGVFATGFRGLFPWPALGRITAACLPGGLLAWGITFFIANPWGALAAGGGVFTLSTLACALLFGAIQQDDKRRLSRFVTERLHV
jgi:O-antigen/teichoic acid export membrane protein